MFHINLKGAEPIWYSWPEDKPEKEQTKLLIRPYPSSRTELKVRRSARMHGDADNEWNLEIVKSGQENKEIFLYCLMDAKGLVDENDVELKINKEITVKVGDFSKKMKIKEYIFDYLFDSGLPSFVLSKVLSIEKEVNREEKN